MPLGLEQQYRLRWMDFDRYGRMQPAVILDYFQDMATKQAEDMGIGRDDMLKHGVFWAVIRTKFEILKSPEHFQEVIVRSWPHSPSRFSFMRDYSMRNLEGELLIKATSEWVLMDVETRKFASVKDYYHGSTDFDTERSFEGKLRKIKDFEQGNRSVQVIVPAFTDIDINGHVNNANYANFVINALKPDQDMILKTCQIDYRHEVLPEVPIEVHTLVEDGLIHSKGIDERGTILFAALAEYESSDTK